MSRFTIFVILAAVLFVVQAHVNGEDLPSCQENEELTFCGRTCEPTCSRQNMDLCLGCAHNVPACKCKDGYVRKGDVCVTPDQC